MRHAAHPRALVDLVLDQSVDRIAYDLDYRIRGDGGTLIWVHDRGRAEFAPDGKPVRLAGTLRIADTPNQTVEGVVRELLKPMLKEWLDKNLPAIVEARVEAELERIARLAR